MQAHWQNERDAIDRIRVLKEQLEAATTEADRYERETGTFDLESLSPSSPDPAGDPITAPSLLRQPD